MKFGKTFRELRLQKSISLNSLASEEISKSQISRFELGESEISFQKMFYLLEAIGLSFEEFLIICNKQSPSFFDDLIFEIKTNTRKPNCFEIKSLKNKLDERNKKFPSTFNRLNVIMIKAQENQFCNGINIEKEDILFLNNYLFSVERFGYFEIILLYNCFNILDLGIIITYLKEILNHFDEHIPIEKNRQALILLIVECVLKSIDLNKLILAKSLMNELEKKILFVEDYHGKTLLLFLKGKLIFQSDQTKGHSMMKTALNIMKTLDDFTYIKYKQIKNQR